jgi:hypothetical protein
MFFANDFSSVGGAGLGKNGVKKMGGWRRLSAEGKRRHKKLFEPARHSIQHTLPASFFCAGDTLPFLAPASSAGQAIFSKALIFFCYLFLYQGKKSKRSLRGIPRRKAVLPAWQL